MSISIRSEY